MFRRWPDTTRLKFYFIFGGWLFVAGIIEAFFAGPGALIVSALGTMFLIRGVIDLSRWRRNRP